MRDIWNPWHGCIRKSEGCAHCYMYAIDGYRGHDGSEIYRTKQGFGYPVQRDRNGAYKVRSGEMLRVCMTSDFFLKEADAWRGDAWSIIRRRPDVVFFLLTKRPERVVSCLPHDWGEGGRMFSSTSLAKTSSAPMSEYPSSTACRSSIRASCAPR